MLEIPYDIILEGFGEVNAKIEQNLINIIDQYRSIKGVNNKALLGLLWFFKSHDDVLLRLEEKYSTEIPKLSIHESKNSNNLKPINKNKLSSLNTKNKNSNDSNNILKQSVELAVNKMKVEKEEKMKIKNEKILEQKR